MEVQQRIAYYQTLESKAIQTAQTLRKRIYLNGSFRLLVFIVGAFGCYFLWHNLSVLIPLLFLVIVVFAFLLTRHNRLLQEKASAEILTDIAHQELKAFENDYSSFDGYAEKIDASHPFSFDLDIFGDHSIFQQVNRTVLKRGKETLATLLQTPFSDKSNILHRQEAIKEMCTKEDFQLNFRTLGTKIGKLGNQAENISFHLPYSNLLKNTVFWKFSVWAVPIIWFLAILLYVLGIIDGSFFVPFYLFALIISVIPLAKVKKIHRAFDKKTKALSHYAQLFELVEKERFESEHNRDILLKIQADSHTTTSRSIHILAKHCHNLEVGFTLAVLLLNPLFLWTTRYTILIEKWSERFAKDTEQWFSALGEVDALISQATFASNRPDYTYPVISDSPFCFEGEGLGHPLLPRNKCVENDIHITTQPFFMIITGANMAGKSTYLRTVGVNHVLGNIGLPVYAKSLTFSVGKLFTNLRTADSLINQESYFFAELKRLKMIINSLESGEKGLFIILDEILKGTNSEDKQKGSYAFMKKLVNLHANGIIATHDLMLGNLENELPLHIANFHFDAEIKDDTLQFSYTLQKGRAKNMNASFLMQRMGIV